MKAATRLRRLLDTERIVMAPCAYDALTAKVIEKVGFSALGVTGNGASASILGKPDVGLVTMTEMVTHAGNIAKAVKIPVYVDAGSGYGNALNVMRTVEEFERVGVAGIFIEDQVFPKRFGRIKDIEILAAEDMIAKIRAAVGARIDPDFMIIARTDAWVISVDEAIERMRAYVSAGADMVKPTLQARTEEKAREELRLYLQSIKVPFHVGLGSGPKSKIRVSDLIELGMEKGIVSFPTAAQLATIRVVTQVMQKIRATGSTEGLENEMAANREFTELIGWPDVYEIENTIMRRKT